MKIVINRCFGGFSLSHSAVELYGKYTGQNFICEVGEWHDNLYYINGVATPENHFSIYDISRNDPALVAVVEALGQRANGDYAALKVVEIPDDVEWVIRESEGLEWVAEIHRTWS